jgi:hypothetical protein
MHLFNRHRTKWTVVVDRPRAVATLTLFDTQAEVNARPKPYRRQRKHVRSPALLEASNLRDEGSAPVGADNNVCKAEATRRLIEYALEHQSRRTTR